jgi:histidine ammonia-lyase
MQNDLKQLQPIFVGSAPLRIEDVVNVALGTQRMDLSEDADFRARIEASANHLERLLARGEKIYGVNTGYGDSCTVAITPALVPELPAHLTRFHGCGMGRILEPEETRAVLVARLNSLAQGHSAVRWELLQALAALLKHDILPRIPAEGSVGASGDLTPLSYVAAVLMGERSVCYQGRMCSATEALADAGLTPITLAPKEGLAIMNGTAVMTGLACLAFHRASYLARLNCRLTALAVAALNGNRDHFEPRFFQFKPHQGQLACARRIYDDLCELAGTRVPIRLQDRYSIRCAPHVIGVLEDALTWIRRDLENELNSANDNPLIDPETDTLFHGGHFYGGHVAFAMDGLKVAVANLADLMDRQLAILVDTRYNQGLPQHLSGAQGERAAINHGLKAAQIAASALTAEALKICVPASIFSRSTECHNQDKVSMGTIASRDCLRVLELTEQVTSILCLATSQALRLRSRDEQSGPDRLTAEARHFFDELQEALPFLEEDRPLDALLGHIVQGIREQRWTIYP